MKFHYFKAPSLVLLLTIFVSVGQAFTTVSATSLPKGADHLYPFTRNGKTGFMNENGNIVIQPILVNPDYFYGGLAAVQDSGGKWGYVNNSGTWAIPASYDAAGAFSEGLAPVRIGKLWGYINQSGSIIISPHFQAAGAFHHGLARIATWNGFTCLDQRGPLTNDTAPEQYFGFPDVIGYTGCTANNLRAGFISTKGALVIPKNFSFAADFSEGIARVKIPSTGDSVGYINEQGTFIAKPQFSDGSNFSEGRVAVQQEGKWGYMDASGKVVIPPRFEFAGDFSEGVASVEIADDKWGYIDTTGNMTIPTQFSDANPFSNGIAIVSGGNSGPGVHFIDHSGRVVVNTSLHVNSGFSGNLAKAETGSEDVYVDRFGKVVRPH